MRFRRSIIVVRTACGVALGAAAIAGCSNGPDFETFPSASDTTLVGSPATQAPPEWETPESTLIAPSTSTTIPPAPTEPPPPTTTLEQSALEGFEAIRTAEVACVVSPFRCDPLAFTVDGSARFEEVVETIDARLNDGLVGYSPAELVYHTVESVRPGSDGKSAIVAYCLNDGGWLMDSNGTFESTSDDILIDDDIVSYRLESALVATPNGWRTTQRTRIDEWNGVFGCGV